MPDFFLAPCHQANANCQTAGIVCSGITTNTMFGLCDDTPPPGLPAYIKLHTSSDWIAEVSNPLAKEVTFKAIDNCVLLLRPNGDLDSRCDGMLYHENNVIFVELKDRASAGWLGGGRDQLIITIEYFAQNHNVNNYNIKTAYVCNKQRPLAVTGISTLVQQFKDETDNILNNGGILLKADRTIVIT